MLKNKINITVSGYCGSGATTLTLILSYIFKREYYHIGGVFRELGRLLGFSLEGMDRVSFDSYLEPIIGTTVDNYIEFILLNYSNIIVESDIAAFRIGKHPKTCSVFLTANQEQRGLRAISDKRDNPVETIKLRDADLQKQYRNLWGFDMFDEATVKAKHNLIMDNSYLTIREEIELCLNCFKDTATLRHEVTPAAYTFAEEAINIYEEQGKEGLKQILTKNNLIVSPYNIIKDIARNFPEDVNTYPVSLQNIFLSKDVKDIS